MESEEKKSLQNRTNMSDRFAYVFRAQTQKKIPLQKKTFVKHFSQIQKESFAKCIMQTEQAKFSQHEQDHGFSNIGFKTEPAAIMKAESITGPE
jgi:hypothetical protein